MTSRKNFENQATPSVIDTEYVNCRFVQSAPHTRIFPGDDTPRTFTQCALNNCDLPPGSTVINGVHGHYVLDPLQDETITIDGEAVVIPGVGWEVGTV